MVWVWLVFSGFIPEHFTLPPLVLPCPFLPFQLYSPLSLALVVCGVLAPLSFSLHVLRFWLSLRVRPGFFRFPSLMFFFLEGISLNAEQESRARCYVQELVVVLIWA